ncbi:glycosyltransferase family 2 protein [Cellulomonas fimi]|uniref:glycosyltransferase family 2 protein n=1 Tax=Cellulomonas fimi TaxID=1708 RepID=UPI0005A1B4BC
MPSVAVVVPSRDDAVLLDRCLTALAAQTVPPAEVVVVDNASRDATAAVARRHGATCLHQATTGIWAAAATGYDAVTAQVVARCDADSVPPPDWVERLAVAFAADPDLAALSGPGRFDGAGRVVRALGDVLYMRAYRLLMGAALAHPPLFGSNLAMRRTVWEHVGPGVHRHRQDLHDDVDLSYHVGDVGRIRYDPTLVVGISDRPLRDAGGLVERVRRALRTIAVHRPDGSPGRRHLRRWSATPRRLRRRAAGGA